jgi:hypothetical protein
LELTASYTAPAARSPGNFFATGVKISRKERVKARNEFSMTRSQRRPEPEQIKGNENKNHQENTFGETRVSTVAPVYSLGAVWDQILTGASCDRL